MAISVSEAINLLERTPKLLNTLLIGLPDHLIFGNEGPDSWSPYDIVGHLIHGEYTDWIPRLKICLSDQEEKTFLPFDRFAQFEISKGKTLIDLLTEFEKIRLANIESLLAFNLTETDYNRTATHPALGKVLLGELLSTWVVHDLNHLHQVTRVLSYQYKDEVGPWKAYLGVLPRD